MMVWLSDTAEATGLLNEAEEAIDEEAFQARMLQHFFVLKITNLKFTRLAD